jgi:hypothetical protein
MKKPFKYSRKISSEEEKEKGVLVLKSSLGKFPAVGKHFELQFGRTTIMARIVAKKCNCRGLQEPHEHYFLKLGGLGLKKGDVVKVQGLARAGFLLSVKKAGSAMLGKK